MCADCNAALVAELPVEQNIDAALPDEPCDLVPVFETLNQHEIILIQAALEAEGIIFHFSGENFHMMGVRPTPARLQVASNRLEDVHAILKELELVD
jgi:hypothetical protein